MNEAPGIDELLYGKYLPAVTSSIDKFVAKNSSLAEKKRKLTSALIDALDEAYRYTAPECMPSSEKLEQACLRWLNSITPEGLCELD